MSESRLIKALKARAVAKREKALMELEMLIYTPAAIGEHTTDHYLAEACKALQDLAEADSDLEMIEIYLSEDAPNQLLKG